MRPCGPHLQDHVEPRFGGELGTPTKLLHSFSDPSKAVAHAQLRRFPAVAARVYHSPPVLTSCVLDPYRPGTAGVPDRIGHDLLHAADQRRRLATVSLGAVGHRQAHPGRWNVTDQLL